MCEWIASIVKQLTTEEVRVENSALYIMAKVDATWF
jgi:hypothetical protein